MRIPRRENLIFALSYGVGDTLIDGTSRAESHYFAGKFAGEIVGIETNSHLIILVGGNGVFPIDCGVENRPWGSFTAEILRGKRSFEKDGLEGLYEGGKVGYTAMVRDYVCGHNFVGDAVCIVYDHVLMAVQRLFEATGIVFHEGAVQNSDFTALVGMAMRTNEIRLAMLAIKFIREVVLWSSRNHGRFQHPWC